MKKANGQVMLLTVLVLSGTILGTTTIAGLLTLYQIRQSTEIINSGKAIFAADAGLECEFYRYIKSEQIPEAERATFCADLLNPLKPEQYHPFTNGASFTTEVTIEPGKRTIKSSGMAGNAIRAFEAVIQ